MSIPIHDHFVLPSFARSVTKPTHVLSYTMPTCDIDAQLGMPIGVNTIHAPMYHDLWKATSYAYDASVASFIPTHLYATNADAQ